MYWCRFDHRRWLDPTRSKSLVQDAFQPFSSGTRVCIAYNLVMVELRLFVAAFFTEFPNAKISSRTTDEGMRIIDRFHIGPRDQCCHINVMGRADGAVA